MIILGIESSCDETAVAIVQDGKALLANVVASSMDLHAVYGGVVPEIAARSHIESIIPVINETLVSFVNSSSYIVNREKETTRKSKHEIRNTKYELDPWSLIDGIAVTYGAGLSGSLLIGVLTARTLAIVKDKPLYAINHVEGHVYANFLVDPQPQFPLLSLIVSGGHSQLVYFRNHFDYDLLGQTTDDAIGEAFDKVAKITGLPYPGGPSIAKAAESGNAFAYPLPKAKVPGKYDFSFSGIKTAVLRTAQSAVGGDFKTPSTDLPALLTDTQKYDIAASFQRVAIATVVDKTKQAYEEFGPKSVVIAGGVAANQELRKQLQASLPLDITYAPPALCTDNGAMIATLGCYKAMAGVEPTDPYSLAINPNLKM
jgi:N6-L-threonylcarbamoyladenine synthase